ncbi:hypothetical protein [Sphingomonas melonis]|uniref:hypothetical protein n=1 Tax=Sphingomonas melonis TaxID=152682 RepID=UPI0035C7F1B2
MPQADDQLGLLLIPPAWTELLHRIQAVCPTAVLAGGALRDLNNGREVKDLDIFISCRAEQLADRAMQDLGEAGFAIAWEKGDTTCYPEDQNLEVVAIMDLLGFDLPVQLIFTNWDTDRILDRFDYGICRIAFDGEKVTTQACYHEDKRDRVFRLRRDRPTPVSMRGSVHRYARLVAGKYPDWTFWPYEPGDTVEWHTIG